MLSSVGQHESRHADDVDHGQDCDHRDGSVKAPHRRLGAAAAGLSRRSWGGDLSRRPVSIVAKPSATATQSADSGYRRRQVRSDRGQSRIITATQAATEQYAMTNHTPAKNGTLAMSHILCPPHVAPSPADTVALDARGGNKPSRRPPVILAVMLNAPADGHMKDPDIAELAVGHGGGEGFKSSPTFPLQPRADFLFINRKNWFLRKDFGRRLTVGIGGLNLQRVGLVSLPSLMILIPAPRCSRSRLTRGRRPVRGYKLAVR